MGKAQQVVIEKISLAESQFPQLPVSLKGLPCLGHEYLEVMLGWLVSTTQLG